MEGCRGRFPTRLLDDDVAAHRFATTFLVGVSGDFDNLTGFLKSVDPETGATQWRWDSTPPSGTPNSTTGGMTWMTGTYDPRERHGFFWGTGNPTPVLNGEVRPWR